MKTHLTLSLSLIVTIAAHAQGTFVLWDEAANGPLSNASGNPTTLVPMVPGQNRIVSATEFFPSGGGPGGTILGDYFTIRIPDGMYGSSLALVTDGPVWVWIGHVSFGEPVTGSAINPPSGDLFAQMGISVLPAGMYRMYMEHGNAGAASFSVSSYQLDFGVVPEPAIPTLLLVGAGGLLAFRRRFP